MGGGHRFLGMITHHLFFFGKYPWWLSKGYNLVFRLKLQPCYSGLVGAHSVVEMGRMIEQSEYRTHMGIVFHHVSFSVDLAPPCHQCVANTANGKNARERTRRPACAVCRSSKKS